MLGVGGLGVEGAYRGLGFRFLLGGGGVVQKGFGFRV